MKKKFLGMLIAVMILGAAVGCGKKIELDDDPFSETYVEIGNPETDTEVDAEKEEATNTQEQYYQCLKDMDFDGALEIIKENDGENFDRRKFQIYPSMICDYRNQTSSDGGNNSSGWSDVAVPDFYSEEYRRGYDEIRMLYLGECGYSTELSEALSSPEKNKYSNVEYVFLGKYGDKGDIEMPVEVINQVLLLAEEQNYGDVDFDSMTVIDFLDWFVVKFAGNSLQNTYLYCSDFEYTMDAFANSEIDLTKNYMIQRDVSGEKTIIEVDDAGQPVE